MKMVKKNQADSPRIYLSVSKPREVRKVVMKAFWRNVALWRRPVVPRLVITPPYNVRN